MNGLDAFKQNGGSALAATDLIKVSITGSRGGKGAEKISTYFGPDGIELDADFNPKPHAMPLDLSGVAGAGGEAKQPPAFPEAEYKAALKESLDKAQAILSAHQQSLTQFKGGGNTTIEDGIIDACLRYCYDYLNFSEIDDATKFVITRKDVVLAKDWRKVNGINRTVYEVRLASRFG